MSVDTEARSRLKATFRRLQEKGQIKKIDVDADDLPIAIPYPNEVPIRGNVHFGEDRAMTREEINKQYKKGWFNI